MATTDIDSKPIPPVDFRNAIITQHWNDPPQTIFHKLIDHHEKLSSDEIVQKLGNILEACKQGLKNTSDKKIISDTEKRVKTLFERLTNNNLSESILYQLGKICIYLDEKDFTNAFITHSNLMKRNFDSEGKWLVGVRRLIDLYQKKISDSNQ
ncbi:hypothetical protein G9A89_005697 [Geosiphon pyriformis]|nr:hypothetical protein G9A89_005697 [Geosiphon pyriformis]